MLLDKNKLRTTPTLKLVTAASEALEENNQELANIYIVELAYRLYLPGENKTFEELLTDLGYKKIDNNGQQKKLVKS